MLPSGPTNQHQHELEITAEDQNSGQSDEDLFKVNAHEPMEPATLADRRGKVCQLVVHDVEGGGKLADLKSLCDLTFE